MPAHFKDFLGNHDVVERFRRLAGEDRLAPAALLVGPEGVGKKTFALLAAQNLNCQSPEPDGSCGRCLCCLKLSRRLQAKVSDICKLFDPYHNDPDLAKTLRSQFETHFPACEYCQAAATFPDVRLIEPSGAQIKIDQMRAVSSDIQFGPFEGRRKVYIFDQAEKLNESAANSILKTLEEPPDYAWIVLVTAHSDALLPTIRSRCPVIRFAPVPAEDIEELLKQRGLGSEKARTLARLSGGSVGSALSQDWEQLERERERGLYLLKQLGQLHVFHAVHKFWAELTAQEQRREGLTALVNLLLVLLRDVFLVKEGQTFKIANTDIVPQLEEVAALYSFEKICELEAQLQTALLEIQRNVNPQILMESLYYERR